MTATRYTATIKLVTAANTNASSIADAYCHGNWENCTVGWSNSVDNCDSDGEGRVYINLSSDSEADLDAAIEYLTEMLHTDGDVSDYDVDRDEVETETEGDSEAFQAATEEGLSFFWAQTHIGHSTQFVGQSWEDGGFSTNESGDPVRDVKGNTVAKFSVESLDATNEQHVAQCEEWFGN